MDGYALFLVFLFLPGFSILELFKIGRELSLVHKVTLAFGLSLSVEVLVLILRTSHLLVAGVYLDGLYANTPLAIIGVSALVLAVSILLHRKFYFYSRPKRTDLLVLSIVLAQGVLVCLHFFAFPIFPEYESVDFGQHVGIVTSLQNAAFPSLPGGVLYYGVHLILVSLLSLTGGDPLIVTQYGMGILISLSNLMVY